MRLRRVLFFGRVCCFPLFFFYAQVFSSLPRHGHLVKGMVKSLRSIGFASLFLCPLLGASVTPMIYRVPWSKPFFSSPRGFFLFFFGGDDLDIFAAQNIPAASPGQSVLRASVSFPNFNHQWAFFGLGGSPDEIVGPSRSEPPP